MLDPLWPLYLSLPTRFPPTLDVPTHKTPTAEMLYSQPEPVDHCQSSAVTLSLALPTGVRRHHIVTRRGFCALWRRGQSYPNQGMHKNGPDPAPQEVVLLFLPSVLSSHLSSLLFSFLLYPFLCVLFSPSAFLFFLDISSST
jgi:hypothetical protein